MLFRSVVSRNSFNTTSSITAPRKAIEPEMLGVSMRTRGVLVSTAARVAVTGAVAVPPGTDTAAPWAGLGVDPFAVPEAAPADLDIV